jgi:L-alanine-DL-glutamate epimerase-like enolase superfamily enzyme
MRRRDFLRTSLAGAALLAGASRAWSDDLPADLRITRVIGFDLPLQRSKVAGKNARLDVHGDRARDRMLWVETSAGIDGIGASNADEAAARELLGQPLRELFRADERRMTGPLGAGTMPLWDLAGKALKKPAYVLLGGEGVEKAPVYDGSIYFADLLPEYESRYADRLREEIDLGLAAGHRAFKIKIGRGNKWMPRAEGDDRDVEIVELIRRHAGDDVLLGVDANNGYDLAGAKRFIDRTAAVKLAFAEEMFEEAVAPCLEFKQHLADNGLKTLVADGETQSKLEPFEPLVAAKAVDVLQGDMKHFGIEGILTEAAMARPQGILVAPHNWGSLVGYYMQLHVGRAIDNFYRAEHDPLSTDVLVAEGYSIADGVATVPDAPGFGLVVNKERFAATIKPAFDLKA